MGIAVKILVAQLSPIVILAVCALSLGASANAAPPFSIRITAPQDTVPIGAVLKVKVELKNNSKHQIIADCLSGSDVRDVQGNPVPKTQRQLDLEGMPKYLIPGAFIMPGQTQNCVLTISEMYEISHPGRYAIQIKQPIGMTLVRSNTLTITVTEPKFWINH